MNAVHLLVMAKSPIPGRVKTRLCPPLRPEQAAEVAEAALADTLEAVASCGAGRRILALDGPVGPWLPPGFEVVPQRGTGFAERLGHAWVDADGPGVQIGMDTPQVTAAGLDSALDLLDRHSAARHPAPAAVLGPASDGGWWAIGLSRPAPEVFAGVPMSTSRTWEAQRARLEVLGWDTADLPEERDVDEVADLLAVAARLPSSRVGAVVAALGPVLR